MAEKPIHERAAGQAFLESDSRRGYPLCFICEKNFSTENCQAKSNLDVKHIKRFLHQKMHENKLLSIARKISKLAIRQLCCACCSCSSCTQKVKQNLF
jgi:hypothetical protein